MKNRFKIKRYATVLALISLTVFVNCAKKRGPDVSASTAVSGGATPSYSKIISSREVLGYLGTALNYNTGTDTALITEFSNLYPTLPQNGDSGYQGSTSRMFSNFALRVCKGSLTNELNLPAANRIVFKYVDLNTAPNTLAGNTIEAQMRTFIKHIGYRFYGVAMPQDEYDQVRLFYEAQRSLVTQDATGARDLATQVCGLIGSSPRALIRM